ncbi:AlbA family DNA-binding domain-containing protein [Sandarakinorhabdus limnophila]|uniref:AlbA family DNA-binding domain-containing protein n=1 Tax=Sandarakinorhabdus limnophila TaxID=210512 RepID=UPI0026EB55AC|nr:ATP-binding protein [Sandarakinorhabdus limnophila]MCM0032075.1 ATP-binding protein [Sandarakinorhabdus limnophila]
MARRSITEEEISLIKAMLARGMKNKDIQFYFNRQDRAVNSGRISGIRDRSYGPEVPTASDESLSAFIANFASPALAAPGIVVETAPAAPLDAMDEKVLRSFFAEASGAWHCTVGETDEFECKEGFSLRNFSKPLRTIAGYANNRGGYLFFGVKDKPLGFAVCGLADDRFTNTDQNKFSQTIRSVLEPTPRFRVASLKLDAMTVGVIHVEPHSAKPVIASKTEGDVVEGAIYYRYPGETKAICYADLRAILDERDQRSREAILPMVQRLLELGPKDAMVANLADGQLEGGQRPIIIDQQLVERIKFIRDGQFDEVDGAETLRLVGDVSPVDLSSLTTIKTVRTELTEESIVRNFVGRVLVEEPLAYVRQASHEQSFLLPLFYYLHLAGQSREGAIADLQAHRNAKPNTAKEIVRRLKRQRTLFVAAGGKRLATLNQIREQSVGEIKSASQAKAVMDAITGIAEGDSEIFEYANGLVNQALEFWGTDRSLVSYLRKAASRLDELVYGPQVADA